MIKQIFLLGGLLMCSGFVSPVFAETISDKDFDGVPDTLDLCPNTPFLREVDHTGCVTSILSLPDETEKESLVMTLGYGFNTNEDLKNREVQHNSRVKISYYLHSWAYALQTGYYTHKLDRGTLDTTLRVKKRIKLNPKLVLNVGAGLRLPSYEFKGNKIDEIFYTSLLYYPTSTLSFFTGYAYTHIGDDEISTILPETPSGETNSDGTPKEVVTEKIQNTHKFYLGVGYFFTNNFYMNFTYSDEKNKFASEHRIKSVSSSIYYKIDEKWFSTLYYKQEVLDGDKHNNLLFTIGYTLW